MAAFALAERAGVDPDDPEPQLAAGIILGLWRTQFRAMQRYAGESMSLSEVRDAVIDDIQRAARVADSGLSSFDPALRPTSTTELGSAIDAANEARRQVVATVNRPDPRGGR